MAGYNAIKNKGDQPQLNLMKLSDQCHYSRFAGEVKRPLLKPTQSPGKIILLGFDGGA
jgi:hypothetical protein